jgi:DNA replication licensing factor MCM5
VYVSYQGNELEGAGFDEEGPNRHRLVQDFKRFIQSFQIGTTKDVAERRLYA